MTVKYDEYCYVILGLDDSDELPDSDKCSIAGSKCEIDFDEE